MQDGHSHTHTGYCVQKFLKGSFSIFSFCERKIKLFFGCFFFLPEVSHEADSTVLDHPPVPDKKTKGD